MKRALMIALFVVLAMALTIPALAHGGQPPAPPPEPVCGPGQDTIAPAEWVPGDCTCPTRTWLWWSFTYDKSADPTKCHRPTATSLGIPSYLRALYALQNPEWLSASCTEGFWIDPICQDPPPPVLCEDDAALNFGEEGDCIYPDPEVTICFNSETLVVPESELAQYEGYTEGACEEPEGPPVVQRVCTPLRLYDLYRYRMEGAPSWYFGGGVCWIKTLAGAPGADLVIQGCSRQCVDPDFVWEGTTPELVSTVYLDCDGTVFSTDTIWDPDWVDLPYAEGQAPTAPGACCITP